MPLVKFPNTSESAIDVDEFVAGEMPAPMAPTAQQYTADVTYKSANHTGNGKRMKLEGESNGDESVTLPNGEDPGLSNYQQPTATSDDEDCDDEDCDDEEPLPHKPTWREESEDLYSATPRPQPRAQNAPSPDTVSGERHRRDRSVSSQQTCGSAPPPYTQNPAVVVHAAAQQTNARAAAIKARLEVLEESRLRRELEEIEAERRQQ